jgi:hypothetical protein
MCQRKRPQRGGAWGRRRGAQIPIGSPLRSTPPSADESKLPARESFRVLIHDAVVSDSYAATRVAG